MEKTVLGIEPGSLKLRVDILTNDSTLWIIFLTNVCFKFSDPFEQFSLAPLFYKTPMDSVKDWSKIEQLKRVLWKW